MVNVTIYHCWEGTPESNWYPWLKNTLEDKGYVVKVPLLMDNKNPTLNDWMSCADPDSNVHTGDLVIGHSLGAVFALKVAEASKVKIGHLILVSGWDFWDLTPEFETLFNLLGMLLFQ